MAALSRRRVVCAGVAELGVFLEPRALHSRELVVAAVNDNQSTVLPGGAHW
jgi:hypothetical protein